VAMQPRAVSGVVVVVAAVIVGMMTSGGLICPLWPQPTLFSIFRVGMSFLALFALALTHLFLRVN